MQTGDEVVTGDIDLQIGVGDEHTEVDDVHLYNLPSFKTGDYVFQGNIGDHGIAAWSGIYKPGVIPVWYIIQMECP